MSRFACEPIVLSNTTFYLYTVSGGRRKGELGLADDTARHIRTANRCQMKAAAFTTIT